MIKFEVTNVQYSPVWTTGLVNIGAKLVSVYLICPLRSFSISLIWDLALDADFNEVADDLSLRVNLALQPVNCTHLHLFCKLKSK